MKICIIVGTRPEIIKMSSIIRLCEKQNLDYFVIHTGQHYSYSMDKIFFEELELSPPKYNLDIGSGTHAVQTAKILEGIEPLLIKESPHIVLVQGDTNTVLAGALAASKLQIKVGHVEAGLRSYDRTMPEEINRVLTDHISDYLFCPTEKSKETALAEGISESQLIVTGNTIVDSVYQNKEIAKDSNILSDLDLSNENYVLVTVHRPGNVDTKERLLMLFEGLSMIYTEHKLKIIVPLHPRTKKMIEKFGLSIPEGISMIESVGFLDFLCLELNARLILTDSGGVQEEACILGVPCVTLRENTERPETIEAGANILSGINPEKMLECVSHMIEKDNSWENPFGDGTAAEKIIDYLKKFNY